MRSCWNLFFSRLNEPISLLSSNETYSALYSFSSGLLSISSALTCVDIRGHPDPFAGPLLGFVEPHEVHADPLLKSLLYEIPVVKFSSFLQLLLLIFFPYAVQMDFVAAFFSALNILQSFELISCISMLLSGGRSYYLVTTKIKTKGSLKKSPFHFLLPLQGRLL